MAAWGDETPRQTLVTGPTSFTIGHDSRVRSSRRLNASSLAGSGLSECVPPYISNAAHHLIGVDGYTYELTVRRA